MKASSLSQSVGLGLVTKELSILSQKTLVGYRTRNCLHELRCVYNVRVPGDTFDVVFYHQAG